MDARFVFATTFPEHNIWDETRQLGYLDSEVLWMYGFFTNCKPSSVTYTLAKLEAGDMNIIEITKVNINELCRENVLGFYGLLIQIDFNMGNFSFYVQLF